MPFLKNSTYRPPFWLFNGHLQTIIPAFRKVPIRYERERIETPDGDFLDLDWIDKNSRRLVVLTHGLEGNSDRPYIAAAAKLFSENGFDVLAWHCRSCSGEMNRTFRLYNHGEVEDLELVVNQAVTKKNYDEVFLIGFSMGGNISLKYASVAAHPSVKKVVAFSSPLEMRTSTAVLDEPSRWVYKNKFQRGLLPKARLKAEQFPDRLSVAEVEAALSSWEAQQELFFVKINGYASLEDFWQRGSAVNFIADLKIPALIVQAQNDPMLTPDCSPISLAKKHPFIHLETPRHGGHCGFPLAGERVHTWAERRALDFINSNF